VERVVVDELEIIYTDLKRVRRFNSGVTLVDRGAELKPSGLEHLYEDLYDYTGRTGKNRTLRVVEHKGKFYERLELEPIDLLPHDDMTDWITQRIEQKIDAKTQLPPPLEPPADWVCNYCQVRDVCFKLAGKEIG
jgi:hypothetical protein